MPRRFYFLIGTLVLLASSFAAETCAASAADGALPNKVIWAWQRKENLEHLDVHEFGVAYLACNVLLEADQTKIHWRDQALKVPPGTRMVPVLRIDTDRHNSAVLSPSQQAKLVEIVRQISQLPHTSEVQIDFDARLTERLFYRELLKSIRKDVELRVPLSITALASWCVFDNWIKDLPVDEAVPMMFSLGPEKPKILLYFRNGGDFRVDICNRSLGVSLEELEVNEVMIPLMKKRKIPARLYVFSKTAWTDKKLESVNTLLREL